MKKKKRTVKILLFLLLLVSVFKHFVSKPGGVSWLARNERAMIMRILLGLAAEKKKRTTKKLSPFYIFKGKKKRVATQQSDQLSNRPEGTAKGHNDGRA
jgi:hypothetical protein